MNIWYKTLTKSPLSPPAIVFKIIWPILYLTMLISLFLVIFAKTNPFKAFSYLVFAIQLILNISWSYIFFNLKNPFFALIVLIFMIIFIGFSIILFHKISTLASYILIPYFLWCLFALYLNIEIVRLN